MGAERTARPIQKSLSVFFTPFYLARILSAAKSKIPKPDQMQELCEQNSWSCLEIENQDDSLKQALVAISSSIAQTIIMLL